MSTPIANPLSVLLKKKTPKLTTFRSMGLSETMLKAISKLKYSFPTRIQREMIPSIMTGRDVFSMGKTGSGKSAGFLIPLIERLKSHSSTVGIRGIVVSPTRELAMQTDKFTRILSAGTDLRIVRLIGGDALNPQFSFLSKNPDIVIGTPGRICHIIQETSLSLSRLEYIVFDEADMLFERGLMPQVRSILQKCPGGKQTVLVSATLPRGLVGFVQSGLKNAVVIRLDRGRIPSHLKMAFLVIKTNERISALMHLIRNIISPYDSTLLFAPTKYHCELIKLVLESLRYKVSIIYGNMFAEARKLNLRQFKKKETNFLITTDVAARGIDIPFLNNVINFNFPSKPKLFVHRVGRAARAGKVGAAYSICSVEELPYLIDLRRFLGESTNIKNNFKSEKVDDYMDNYIGTFPQNVLDDGNETLKKMCEINFSIQTHLTMSKKAEMKYKKTRKVPSSKSIREAREMKIGIHPILLKDMTKEMVSEMQKQKKNEK